MSIKPLFDQSVFVKAALNSVLLSACMAAALTALVIILFLGNVRLSVIILAAIPLSIITAVLFINLAGQTLNTMTLGGFALAIGILVDNGTVVIENIERHVAMREPLHQSIVTAPAKWRFRRSCRRCAFASSSFPCSCCRARPSICSRRLSLSVIGALLASLALSFTMVPVLFNFLMRRAVHELDEKAHRRRRSIAPRRIRWCDSSRVRARVREISRKYRNTLAWALSQARLTVRRSPR
jgi:multidrug efflux pump subunit AcrB